MCRWPTAHSSTGPEWRARMLAWAVKAMMHNAYNRACTCQRPLGQILDETCSFPALLSLQRKTISSTLAAP